MRKYRTGSRHCKIYKHSETSEIRCVSIGLFLISKCYRLLFYRTQFLDDVRRVMGIPEWMMDIDARKTKTLHNGACIQMIIHFKGPNAHHLEQDFSRLLVVGRLDAPSLFIPGYYDKKRKPTVSYKTCGVRDPNEKKSSRKKSYFSTSSSCTFQPKTVLSLGLIVVVTVLKTSML